MIRKYIILISCFCFILSSFAKQNDTIKVGYTGAPPFIIENNGDLQGVNIWLWDRIAKDLNLQYKLVPMQFSEMLNGLSKQTIDVSINPLTITSERNKLMDFTDSFYASNATIAVTKSSGLQKLFSFIKGFFSVNFLKGLLALLTIILLFGLLGWHFEKQKNPDHFRKGIRGVWDGLWWSAVTLTTVGYGDKAPKSKGGKITALVLMFGGLLFISGLTASIASSLTVTQINSNPNSFNEFKDRTVGCINNTGTNTFLKERFFKNVTLYPNVSQGLAALKNNDVEAFIYDEPILKYRIKHDNHLKDIQILPMKFNIQFYAFGISKNKPELEQKVSQKILEIIETQEWEILLNEYGISEF